MSSGFTGKILHVDLFSQSIQIEEPGETFYRQYGGGSAMGAYYLLRDQPPRADPFGPDNILTVFVGPATGAPISGQSRVTVSAKSPLTGGIGESQAGGFWPARLKMAGFDGIVIKGQSDKPVYLWIHDGQATLCDARHLWGKVTGDAEQLIKEELGKKNIEVMQIGPGGEKLVRFSNIINMLSRANGRCGLGSVMGSKKVKAIVVEGNQSISIYDPNAIKDLANWGKENFEQSDVYGLGINGTADVLIPQQEMGSLPTRNWNSGSFEDYLNISGPTLTKTILKKRDTCFACIVRCKRVVENKDGDFNIEQSYGGPEYETLGALGSYCGISDLVAISKGNQLCNMYGLDTISCGATIAWAMDCYERGIITIKDTSGIDLHFGNAQAMVDLVEMIGKREGFGDILAEGSARAAKKYGKGAEDLVVAVKNQELPAHMPEAKRSLALIYAVNSYGADHQSHEHDTSYTPEFCYTERMAEIGLMNPQPKTDLGSQKVRYSLYTQWVYSACNSLCVCQFVYGPAWHLYSTSQLVELIRATTGWNFSLYELMKMGERTVNMQRAFNAREGFGRAEDILPKKLFQPRVGGVTDGVAITHEELEFALENYYQMCGWDQDGKPKQAKLEELGIGWIAN
jgi:aldehyde:ferredoxin oxidoreductase